MPPPTNGELRDRVRELEAALADCETDDSGTPNLHGRVRELEGLLAGCTRQLEQCQRELAEALDALDQQPLSELAEVQQPAHLAALEAAIERLAGMLSDAETDADDLITADGDLPEARVEVIADAIRTLSQAHQAIAPKPLPPIR